MKRACLTIVFLLLPSAATAQTQNNQGTFSADTILTQVGGTVCMHGYPAGQAPGLANSECGITVRAHYTDGFGNSYLWDFTGTDCSDGNGNCVWEVDVPTTFTPFGKLPCTCDRMSAVFGGAWGCSTVTQGYTDGNGEDVIVIAGHTAGGFISDSYVELAGPSGSGGGSGG